VLNDRNKTGIFLNCRP